MGSPAPPTPRISHKDEPKRDFEILLKSTNGSTINLADPKAIEGAATLLNEVMDVFQSTPYLHIGGDPSLAVDGNLDIDKHWAGKTPSSLTVDLQKAYRVGRITLVTYYDGSRYYQFTIEVSTDGQKWMTVDDASKNTGAAAATGYESRFKPVQARCVRVNMLKNSANQGTHIVELMVFEAK